LARSETFHSFPGNVGTAYGNEAANLRRRSISLTVALLAFLTLAAGTSCGKKGPVKLGFVGGLTGRVADLGISGRNGAILAVEMKNDAGGVNGRKVELLVRDDQQDPDVAVRVDRGLIDAGVAAIIGHMTSVASVAAVPLADERKVVLVSPTTTAVVLSGKDDHFLRVIGTTRDYSILMARYLRKDRGLKSVSLAYDLGNRSYTEGWFVDFRKEFETLGGKVVRVVPFQSGHDLRMHDLVPRLLAPGVQGIVMVASAMDTAKFCQHLRKKGVTLPVAASEWSGTERLIDFGGIAVEGVAVTQFFDRDSRAPTYIAFREAYRKRFGVEPGFASVTAFDAANVVLEALCQAKAGESLKAAILRISRFPGVQGPFTIDRFGDAARECFITVVKDGRFRKIP
jgi:branched-chain amino acid transport system substrate-binding protein